MLGEHEIALRETFRAQAEIRRRDLGFFLETEHEFEKRKVESRRAEDLRETLDQLQRATDHDIALFRDHLDHYDTAVVEALTDNEEALVKAKQERARIEAGAVRLPDGRMVFKTEDGKRVVDQFDREVPREAAPPESIPNGLPSWEAYKAVRTKEANLETERDELHRYQQRLDDARDTIGKGDVSKAQLDSLDADLRDSMPEAVRQKLAHPGQSPEAARPAKEAPGLPGMPPSSIEGQPYRLGPSLMPR